jgi:tRNA dimethylallyltransferase
MEQAVSGTAPTLPEPVPLRWLAVAGPTASGKSAWAMQLAQAVGTALCGSAATPPVEIVSVDSALVYRGMDIGTAKPTPAEQQQVPHHLLDVLDPAESYSAARFVTDAHGALQAIWARGHFPLLVGGTMLYFKALLQGLDEMPGTDPVWRERIAQEARELGWPALHQRLQQLDPVTAARLAPNDSQRIGRALEVVCSTGQPLSAYHRQGASRGAEVGILGQPGVLLSLEPQERSWLHQRIEQRFAAMLQQGFLEEMRQLRQRQDLHPGLPALRCVGYRQAWEWLSAGTEPLAVLQERGAAATRQLAKRQLTWLRSMPERVVLPADDPQALQAAVAAYADRVVAALRR